MLDPADVQVNAIVSHPVPLCVFRDEFSVIVGVEVPQVIPAGTRPLGHRVELPRVRDAVDIDVLPIILCLDEQRCRHSVFVIRDVRRVVVDLRKSKGKILERHCPQLTVRTMKDRDRLAPVALTREEPVTKLVCDRPFACTVEFEPSDGRAFGVLYVQPIEEATVHGRPLTGVRITFEVGGRLHGSDDRQIERLSELPVADILAGYGHDRTCAVSHEDVVGDEDGDVLPVERIDRVRAGEHTGLVALFDLPLQFGFPRRRQAIGLDRGGRVVDAKSPGRLRALWPDVGGDLINKRMLRCHNHVGRTEDGVGAGREHLQLAVTCDLKHDVGALGSPDPVPLHRDDRVGPVHGFEVVKEPIGIRSDPKHPLAQGTLEHRVIAPFGATFCRHFLVRQDGAKGGAPVDGDLIDVGKSLAVQMCSAISRRQVVPRSAVCVLLACLQFLDKFRDRSRLLEVFVEPRVEQLQEDPLCPLVVVRIRGGE